MEDEASQGASTQSCSSDPCCAAMSSEEAFGRTRHWLFDWRLGRFGGGRLAAAEELVTERELRTERSWL